MNVDYTEINFQDNIPWNKEEIEIINGKISAQKRVPKIMGYCTIPVSVFIIWLEREEIKKFTSGESFALLSGVFLLFGVVYFLGWAFISFFISKLKKDLKNGKSILHSFIINKDKTENDEYFFTFAVAQANEKIRLLVDVGDYKKYAEGTRLIVEYLKFTKEILKITKEVK